MEEIKIKETKDKPLRYRAIENTVRLLTPKYDLIGIENLPDEPCVLVGNHSQLYGPVSAALYTPRKQATWCDGYMMHKEEVPEYTYRVFWSEKPGYIRWFYKGLSRVIGPLCEFVFTNANTIAVYRDARLITTFRQSIALLQQGVSVVIFPECFDEYNNVIHRFQDRFIDIARLYYRKTHKELCFVPMYVAPYLGKICYGKPIRFNAEASVEEERVRICKELMDAVTEMALSLPPHLVVPFPNVSKRLYHKNVPLEIYHEQ